MGRVDNYLIKKMKQYTLIFESVKNKSKSLHMPTNTRLDIEQKLQHECN